MEDTIVCLGGRYFAQHDDRHRGDKYNYE